MTWIGITLVVRATTNLFFGFRIQTTMEEKMKGDREI
jgi:hypothetical protein